MQNNENEINIVKLEDGLDYIVLKEMLIDNINYLLLVNMKNSKDYCIRKEINDMYVGLDNDEEFDRVSTVFMNQTLKDNN